MKVKEDMEVVFYSNDLFNVISSFMDIESICSMRQTCKYYVKISENKLINSMKLAHDYMFDKYILNYLFHDNSWKNTNIYSFIFDKILMNKSIRMQEIIILQSIFRYRIFDRHDDLLYKALKEYDNPMMFGKYFENIIIRILTDN